MPTQLAPCPLRLPSALSPRRYDHQPVAIFDEPGLVRVPRTAHVLPATPPAYNPCPCTLRHPRGLVSPGSRTGPSSMLSRRPPLPWQVRVGDPQAASAALSDAVQSDAALPDAAACCNAPPAFPGHSPCPRASTTSNPSWRLYHGVAISRSFACGALAWKSAMIQCLAPSRQT